MRERELPEPTPFSSAFAAAVDARGLSLEKLYRRLQDVGSPVSIATLSYWRAGHRRPEQPASLEALDALEEILGVPAGHLRTKLEMTRRSPGSGTRKSLDEVMPQGDRVRELLTDLGFPQTVELLELATQVTVDMDERGHGSSYTARGVFRGVRDGVDRLPFVFWMEGPDAELPKFEPMHGCEMGRSVVDAEAGIYALELLLEAPLGAGESTVLEHRVHIPRQAMAGTSYEHALVRRMNEILLWVRFHPDKVPERGEAYIRTEDSEETFPLETAGRLSMHFQGQNVGPGQVGIRWFW